MTSEKLNTVKIRDAKIKDCYWSRYIDLIHDIIIPYQWKLMNDQIADAAKSGCIHNFKVAAGKEDGKFCGMPFQDSDLAKWLEAVAYSLESRPDKELEALADNVIELIEAAQEADGYLDTYFILKEPGKRWLNLMEGHELYVAGHFIEAGVAYFQATGKDRLLKVVCRMADLIHHTFGVGEGQIKGYPGHQEIELALIKLYEMTHNKQYLETAYYFIMERGQEPNTLRELHMAFGRWLFPEFEKFDPQYMQMHLPVISQVTAEGHAVRAVYMYSAMADLAFEYKDTRLLETCEKIYENIVKRRMYITGSIGSAGMGERFTCDYDLPNDTNYSESCASVGLAMFCHRMFRITRKGSYMDTVELALYNTVAAGIALTGTGFFYVNPLEAWPQSCESNPSKEHVKYERQKWFQCACCPPNIARTLASLQKYAYNFSEDTLFINLFTAGQIRFNMKGRELKLSIKTNYPFNGKIEIFVEEASNAECLIALRRPGWSLDTQLQINGKPVSISEQDGYLYINRVWKTGDYMSYTLEMKPRLIGANPRVRADAGKAAIQKGPLIYCMESCDNGENLSAISISSRAEITEEFDEKLLGGSIIITLPGRRIKEQGWDGRLYKPWSREYDDISIKAVPYCFWNNRGKGEMQVWTRVEDTP